MLAWAAFALGYAALSSTGRVAGAVTALLAAAVGVAAVALWRRS